MDLAPAGLNKLNPISFAVGLVRAFNMLCDSPRGRQSTQTFWAIEPFLGESTYHLLGHIPSSFG